MTGHAQILKRCYSRLLETLQSIRVVNTQHGRPPASTALQGGGTSPKVSRSEVAELGISLLSWQGECGGEETAASLCLSSVSGRTGYGRW